MASTTSWNAWPRTSAPTQAVTVSRRNNVDLTASQVVIVRIWPDLSDGEFQRKLVLLLPPLPRDRGRSTPHAVAGRRGDNGRDLQHLGGLGQGDHVMLKFAGFVIAHAGHQADLM